MPGDQSVVNHTYDLKPHAAGQGCVNDSEISGDYSGDDSSDRPLRDNKRRKTAHQSSGQRQQRGDDDAGDDGEYEVEQILDARIYRKRLEYRVDWRNYEPDPTWYRASGFKKSPSKLSEFHKANPQHPGPPKNLDEWARCFEEDKDADDYLDDDKP
jgi:hypothetical protein